MYIMMSTLSFIINEYQRPFTGANKTWCAHTSFALVPYVNVVCYYECYEWYYLDACGAITVWIICLPSSDPPTKNCEIIYEYDWKAIDIYIHWLFESAILIIQQRSINAGSPAELRAVWLLKKISDQKISDQTQTVKHDNNMTCVEHGLTKRKYESETSSLQKGHMIDLRCLVPTSTICERQFSRNTRNEWRLSIVPVNAQAQMILHVNVDVWNIRSSEGACLARRKQWAPRIVCRNIEFNDNCLFQRTLKNCFFGGSGHYGTRDMISMRVVMHQTE